MAKCYSLPNQINFKIQSNPLPDAPILGSTSSAANKDVMSKIWTNGDTII